MPKWLIGVIIFVIALLVGVNVYIFYSYFTFKPKPQVQPVVDNTPKDVSLSGKIKSGWLFPQNQGYCGKSYYLISETGTVEVNPSDDLAKKLANGDFRHYNNLQVSITGTTHKGDNSSCGDFVSAETIKNNDTNSLESFEVTGKIACLPGSENSEDGCIQALQIDNAYIALIKDNVVLNTLTVGDTMRVVGVVDSEFTSPDNFDAGITVTTIEKI